MGIAVRVVAKRGQARTASRGALHSSQSSSAFRDAVQKAPAQATTTVDDGRGQPVLRKSEFSQAKRAEPLRGQHCRRF